MKKFIKGLVITILAVIIGGAALMYGCTALFVESVDQAIEETEKEEKLFKDEVQVLFDQLEWEIVRTDEWNCTLEAKFTNTLDKEISYMEIDYKFFDANGNVIDASWTNESNIAPGETRLIKIYPIYSEEGEFASYEIILKEANHYEE